MNFEEISRLWQLQQSATIQIRDMEAVVREVPKARQRESRQLLLEDASGVLIGLALGGYALWHAATGSVMRTSFLLVTLLSAGITAISLLYLCRQSRAGRGFGPTIRDQIARALVQIDLTIRLRSHNLWFFVPVFLVWAFGAAEKTMVVETPAWWPLYLAGGAAGFPVVFWISRKRLHRSLDQLRERRHVLEELLARYAPLDAGSTSQE